MLSTLLLFVEYVVIIAFVGFGLQCLFSQHMVAEFRRYGLPSFRILTGFLQVAGGLGVLGGLFYRPLLIVSSGGLASLMFLGAVVRFRIRDPLIAASPALFLMFLNLLILARTLGSAWMSSAAR
jgi:hypothetical protein